MKNRARGIGVELLVVLDLAITWFLLLCSAVIDSRLRNARIADSPAFRAEKGDQGDAQKS